jgi:hypothetical protein
MSHSCRAHVLAAAAACCLASGGCTVVKPVIGAAVGAVAGPALLIAGSDGNLGACGCDARAIVVVLAISAAVGASIGGAAGLVTGIISDVRYVCGYSADPTSNWWDPFKINDGG